MNWSLLSDLTSIDISGKDDFANVARDLILGDERWARKAKIARDATDGNARQFHVILGAHFAHTEFLKG